MPDAYNAPEKVCQICGQDCSHKPRAKDANGRYVCKECMERAKDAKSAREAPPPVPAAKRLELPEEANSYVLDIPDKPLEKGMIPCASCGKPKREDAVLCVQCGFDSRKNERRHVKVLKPEVLKGERERRKSRVYLGPELALLGLGLIVSGLLAGSFFSDDLVLPFVGAFALQGLLFIILALIVPIQEGEPGWSLCAVVWLVGAFLRGSLYGRLGGIGAGIAFMCYGLFISSSISLRIISCFHVIATIGMVVLGMQGITDRVLDG